MFNLLSGISSKVDLEATSAPRQQGVMRGGQINPHKVEDGADKSLSLAQWYMKDLTNNKAAKYSGISIKEGPAWSACRDRVNPVSTRVRVKPDGETSPPDKRGVILRPVTDAVSRFGGFVVHKMRLPDLLHP